MQTDQNILQDCTRHAGEAEGKSILGGLLTVYVSDDYDRLLFYWKKATARAHALAG